MRLQDIIDDGDEFHYHVEQALRGQSCGDRRVWYHYIMREMRWSWRELMKTPYDVVYRTAVILSIENAMQQYQIKKEMR